jgi:hypothetical protein
MLYSNKNSIIIENNTLILNGHTINVHLFKPEDFPASALFFNNCYYWSNDDGVIHVFTYGTSIYLP